MRTTTARATQSSSVFAALPSQPDGTCTHEAVCAATETPLDPADLEYSNEQPLQDFAQQTIASASYHWNHTIEANANTTASPFGSSWAPTTANQSLWSQPANATQTFVPSSSGWPIDGHFFVVGESTCNSARVNARNCLDQVAGPNQQSRAARRSWAPDRTPPSDACVHSDSDGSWDISSYSALERWTPDPHDMSSFSVLSSRRGSHGSRSLIGFTGQEPNAWVDVCLPQVEPWSPHLGQRDLRLCQYKMSDTFENSALVSDSFPVPSEIAAQFAEEEPTLLPIITNTKRVGKRKGPLSVGGRNKAKRVRRIKPCIRCKMYKEGCDENNPCTRCVEVSGKARTWLTEGPCYRDDLSNVLLVRIGNGKFNEKEAKFREYRYISLSQPATVLEINWQLPQNAPLELPNLFASVRRFRPTKFDIIHEEWSVDGERRNIVLPAVAWSDKAELTKSLESYVERCRPAMQELMLSQITDELCLATFHEATRYARVTDSKIVKLALKVRTTALLSAGWGSLVGAETLDIPRVVGASAGYCGDIPIPVPLSHQFDVVFRLAMRRTEREVVKLLKSKIFHTKPRPWYEIFLTYFVLLTHLQFIHDQAVGFMKARQQTKSGRHVSVIVEEMIGKWNYSAGNMLHHYRCVLNGDIPFRSAERTPDLLRERDSLDDESMDFIAKAHKLIKNMDDDDGDPDLENDHSWARSLFREHC